MSEACGRLTLGATPIGNLGDISQRLLDAMGSVHEIWCEDTRVTRRLLNHFQITNTTKSFHEFSSDAIRAQIKEKLNSGAHILYVSDAGMPAISDPGFELVQIAREVDAEVDVLPGPSSVLNALVLSGFSCHQFAFMGFFPEKKGAQEALLQKLADMAMTTIHFESPHRIERTLKFLTERIPETQVALCRELTKKFQEVLIDRPHLVLEKLTICKGEMVLVIEPMEKVPPKLSPIEHYDQLIGSGLLPKEAMKATAAQFSMKRREVYNLILEAQSSKND